MSDQTDDQSPQDGELQFDYAEYEESHVRTLRCGTCLQPIGDTYYEVSAQMSCPRCAGKAQGEQVGGSRWRRFIRATVFGGIGAGIGAGIYYAIMAATEREFALVALVAIVVGLLVGGGVKIGSRRRGGWFYLLLAVGMTYLAIVCTYIPFIIKEIVEMELPGAHPASAPATSTAPADSQPAGTTSAPAQPLGPVEQEPCPPEESPSFEEMTAGQKALAVAIALLVLIVLAMAVPIVAAFEGGVIGLLIIGVALYEAWYINKRPKIEITGPYYLAVAEDTGSHEPEAGNE